MTAMTCAGIVAIFDTTVANIVVISVMETSAIFVETAATFVATVVTFEMIAVTCAGTAGNFAAAGSHQQA
jgi:hypothetical protein